jgi:hypothetical protein
MATGRDCPVIVVIVASSFDPLQARSGIRNMTQLPGQALGGLFGAKAGVATRRPVSMVAQTVTELASCCAG